MKVLTGQRSLTFLQWLGTMGHQSTNMSSTMVAIIPLQNGPSTNLLRSTHHKSPCLKQFFPVRYGVSNAQVAREDALVCLSDHTGVLRSGGNNATYLEWHRVGRCVFLLQRKTLPLRTMADAFLMDARSGRRGDAFARHCTACRTAARQKHHGAIERLHDTDAGGPRALPFLQRRLNWKPNLGRSIRSGRAVGCGDFYWIDRGGQIEERCPLDEHKTRSLYLALLRCTVR
jgi:hypothetical protein